MSSKYLYITGDSYCFYRTDASKHWPACLAKLLNLELLGQGYPGEGWWPSRLDFFEKYGPNSQSDLLEQTEIFIFCHTDIHRPVTGNKNWIGSLSPEFLEYHLKYCSDPEVDAWCASKWYKEINKILAGKTVINLNCFNSNQSIRSFLPGKVYQTNLIDLSTIDHGGDTKQIRSAEVISAMNKSQNHFTTEANLKLANFLFANLNSQQLKISL